MAWKPDYLTTDEAKAYLRIDDTVDDDELDLIVSAASRAIDRTCNRQFGKVAAAEERFYTAYWDRSRTTPRWVVEIDDLATTTDLVVEVNGTAVTDYTLEPRNAVAKGKVWTHLVIGGNAEAQPCGADDEMGITAQWGWPAVPSSVKAAGRLQTSRLIARRDSPYGVAGSPQEGSEIRLLAKVDPDVAVMLVDYFRWWGAR